MKCLRTLTLSRRFTNEIVSAVMNEMSCFAKQSNWRATPSESNRPDVSLMKCLSQGGGDSTHYFISEPPHVSLVSDVHAEWNDAEVSDVHLEWNGVE